MANIEIQLLGKFEIRVNGKPVLAVLNTSRKATLLLEYLILKHGEKISHKEITDTLWAGERSSNPDMALRAILHRFRNMMEDENLPELADCIVTGRGYYQWNPRLECKIDVYEMERLMGEASRQVNPERRSRLCERVVRLYDGRLLPQDAAEPWVESYSIRLHGMYRSALFTVLDTWRKNNDHTSIITACRRAVELDPYEERIYLELIMALEQAGRHDEAMEVIRRGSAMGCLHRTLDPAMVDAACRRVRQADSDMQDDAARLMSDLPEEMAGGATLCNFENFRQIYNLQRGVQARYGIPVYLALLTVSPPQEAEPSECGAMMEILGSLLHTNLRRCDAASRYGACQYVVLLSGSNSVANGNTPLERIKAAFYRVPAHGRYLLTYSLYAPENKNDAADRKAETVKK